MVQFLSVKFFVWISSIFVGFFKSSPFFVSLCILTTLGSPVEEGGGCYASKPAMAILSYKCVHIGESESIRIYIYIYIFGFLLYL